jgi:hypothetical protein
VRLLRLLPAGTIVAGWDSHPLEDRAFARRTDNLTLNDRNRTLQVVYEHRLRSAEHRASSYARAYAALLDAGRSGATHRQDATFRATTGAAAHGDRPQATTGRIDSCAEIRARRSVWDRAI